MFEGIDGAGVFLGVFESGVAQERGDGFDVGTVVEQIDCERMSGTVPCDVFLDSCTGSPVAQCLQAHGV